MNGASQDPMEEIFAMFRAESREHVNRITELLLALERGEVEEAELEELFRAAHSLKGSASTLGVNRVAEIAHAMEDVFGAVKRGEFGYDEKANTEILTALDLSNTGLLTSWKRVIAASTFSCSMDSSARLTAINKNMKHWVKGLLKKLKIKLME